MLSAYGHYDDKYVFDSRTTEAANSHLCFLYLITLHQVYTEAEYQRMAAGEKRTGSSLCTSRSPRLSAVTA